MNLSIVLTPTPSSVAGDMPCRRGHNFQQLSAF
jgi:hypothetical protein